MSADDIVSIEDNQRVLKSFCKQINMVYVVTQAVYSLTINNKCNCTLLFSLFSILTSTVRFW